MSQDKFKVLKSIKDGVKTIHIDKDSYEKATTADQVSFLTAQIKDGYMIDICVFPTVSLNNIDSMIKAFRINPALMSQAINNTIEAKGKEELQIVDNFNNALTVFSEAYDNLIALATSKYNFETIPSGYDLDRNFKFLTSRVRRTNDAEYFLEHDDIKLLMNECLDQWSTNKQGQRVLRNVQLRRQYNRDVTIDHNSIRIGCQTVRRYEFEQIAIRLGFKGKKFETTLKLSYSR